jgi:hypothetical protein
MAYRSGPPAELPCPRCNKALPALDIAACSQGCGTWVSRFAASVAFREGETVENKLTRWWRVRAPCPECGDKMTLRGDDPALLQGCDVHGYFVDADVVAHTGLARGDFDAALAKKREDTAVVEAEQEEAERLAVEKAREREARERTDPRIAELRRRFATPIAPLPDDPFESIKTALREGRVVPLIDHLRALTERVAELEARASELELEVDELKARDSR